MNTATQTPPATELADRFRCESDVPDPPRDAAGRKQYWEDTVAEAVAELRRRLASTRDEKSFQALHMILDLEKTRLRHKAPVAGTEVGGGYSSGLRPVEECVPGGRYEGPKKVEKKDEDLTPPAPPATLSVPERVDEASRDREAVASSTQTKMPLPGVHGSPDNDSPSPPETAPPAPPPRRCYRYAKYPLDAPINVMTDDEYNAYRRWQGFWPGVPPGWPNWPPKPVVPDAPAPAPLPA